jgi:hypothetical protein
MKTKKYFTLILRLTLHKSKINVYEKNNSCYPALIPKFFRLFAKQVERFCQKLPCNALLDVNIECGNTLNLQVLNSIDGKKYLSDNKSDISIYYKVGKITFHNGNLGLAYAVRSGERLYYSIDIFDKNGKFKDSYALGTSYSVGGGSLFKIMKAEKKYKVWQKTQKVKAVLYSEKTACVSGSRCFYLNDSK